MAELSRITVVLPQNLVEQINEAIAKGHAENLDRFIALALEQRLSNLNSDSDLDPIWQLGSNPVVCDVTDASEHLDRYLYKSE